MAEVTEVSRKQTLSREGATVTRVLRVKPYYAWSDVALLLLGGIRVIGGTLVRTPPLGDPAIPWAFAKSVDVDGFGAITGTGYVAPEIQLRTYNNYQAATLTVTYESNALTEADMTPGQTEQNEMDLANQSTDISAQQLTLPSSYFFFLNSPNLPLGLAGVNAVKTMPNMKYVVARSQVVNEPIDAYTKLVGRINRNPFRIGRRTWQAETLRLDGVTTSQKITNLGFKYYDIQYTFAVQPAYDYVATSVETVDSSDPKIVTTPSTVGTDFVGWNRVFRADRGFWDRPQCKDPIAGTITKGMYEYDDGISQVILGSVVSGFRLLFNPGAY